MPDPPKSVLMERLRGLKLIGGLATLALFGRVVFDRRLELDDRRSGVWLQIDPNRAPSAVLEALPRIGPTLAERMVEARDRTPFVGVDDLDRRVKGIGPATIRAIRPYLRLPD